MTAPAAWPTLLRGLVVLVGLAVFVGAAAPASAQPRRRLALVPVETPGGGIESTAELVRAAADLRDDRLELVGDGVALARQARSDGAVPAARLTEMAAVSQAGAEGWRAYLQVAVPFAASRLAKARSDAEALVPLPGGLELYADLSLRLGAVLLALERRDEADEALALARTLDPARELSLIEFSPDIVEAAERAAQQPAAPAQLTIVTPGVSGARIEVDGRAAGVTAGPGGSRAPGAPGAPGAGPPMLRLTIPRGQHVVVARHAGHEPVAQALRLEASAQLTLRLEEDPLATALARPGAGLSEERSLALVEAVLTYADADEVLLVAVTARRGAPALLAQRCDGRARCTAVVEVGYQRPGLPAALRAAWALLARGELRYPPSLPGDSRVLPGSVAGGESKCRLCRNPWLWAGVGTAVAASAALILALAQDDPLPVLVVDPDIFRIR